MDDATEFAKPIRRVTSLNPVDSYLSGSWEALGAGAPVLVALAQICSQALIDSPDASSRTFSRRPKPSWSQVAIAA